MLLLLSVLLLIASIIIHRAVNTEGSLMLLVMSTLLMIFTSFGLLNRIDCVNYVIARNSLQQTLNVERTKGIESAAIAAKVMEFNSELAQKEYWANNIWFGVYYTDAFRNLKPLL